MPNNVNRWVVNAKALVPHRKSSPVLTPLNIPCTPKRDAHYTVLRNYFMVFGLNNRVESGQTTSWKHRSASSKSVYRDLSLIQSITFGQRLYAGLLPTDTPICPVGKVIIVLSVLEIASSTGFVDSGGAI